jgi:hypothetical protein
MNACYSSWPRSPGSARPFDCQSVRRGTLRVPAPPAGLEAARARLRYIVGRRQGLGNLIKPALDTRLTWKGLD